MIKEACIGETFGVLVIARALHQVRSRGGPSWLREHFEMTLRDESEHARLAWRTLRWLVESDRPSHIELDRRRLMVTEQIIKTLSVSQPAEQDQPITIEPALGMLTHREHDTIFNQELPPLIMREVDGLLTTDQRRSILEHMVALNHPIH